MREQVSRVLESLRLPNGLYLASPAPSYHYVWVRDTCYAALALLMAGDTCCLETYHALFDIFRRYRWKIEYHSGHRPVAVHEYIHPRYHARTCEELHEPWGNAQNDAIGAFLFGVGQCARKGLPVWRDEQDRCIAQLLANYLGTLEYWTDADNGMWEENREVHASSIGACAAGLLAARPFLRIDWTWIRQGLKQLFTILPAESATKPYDLAQLSLIYPYRLLPADLAQVIVQQVETMLLRDRGVIRYPGDQYFSEEGAEAQWCMGLPWLGLCHVTLGNKTRAREYLERTEAVMPATGVIPELYLAHSQQPNENTPLAWAQAMYLLLHHELARAQD